MEHKQLKSEKGNLHYWIQRNENPSAKCIVFTHGLTADHRMFEKQVEYFSAQYTIVTWDVPLHGRSQPYGNFSYKETALALNRILERENIHKVVLVGMSMGGYPSQEHLIRTRFYAL